MSQPDAPAIQILPDEAALARAAADAIVRYAQDAIVSRGRAIVALSGGRTPRRLFDLLARPPHSTRLDFSRIDFFLADERCVPPDDEESNFGAIDRLLFRPARVPPERTHRVRCELGSAAAAADYEARLRKLFPGGWPRLDLILLGLGADGHTASLFPGQPAIEERSAWAVAARSPVAGGVDRVTLTLPAIASARQIIFVVSGADKADIVARLFGVPAAPPAAPPETRGSPPFSSTPACAETRVCPYFSGDAAELPAAGVILSGSPVAVLLDAAAAAGLAGPTG